VSAAPRRIRRGGRNPGHGARILQRAKTRKNDEFYTLEIDIKKELRHYRDVLRGKTIHCNCDHPGKSAFAKLLWRNFDRLGLERLIATHYLPPAGLFEPSAKPWKLDYRRGFPKGRIRDHVTKLAGDGDFGSWEVKELTRQADIVITNPPFSRFRDFVRTMVECNVDFLAIGDLTAMGGKYVFDLLKQDRIRFGYKIGGGMQFKIPARYRSLYPKAENGLVFLGSARWYTTLPTPGKKVIEPTVSFADHDDWATYDGTDIINIDWKKDIPKDYDGVMGVPVSYFEVHDPEKFEIVGQIGDDPDHPLDSRFTPVIDGNLLFYRFLIRRKR